MKGILILQSLRALRDLRRARLRQLREAITKSLAVRELPAATSFVPIHISPPPDFTYAPIQPHSAKNQPLNEPLEGVFYVV